MAITAARKRLGRFIVGSSLDCFVFPVIPVSWIGFKPASVARRLAAPGNGGNGCANWWTNRRPNLRNMIFKHGRRVRSIRSLGSQRDGTGCLGDDSRFRHAGSLGTSSVSDAPTVFENHIPLKRGRRLRVRQDSRDPLSTRTRRYQPPAQR